MLSELFLCLFGFGGGGLVSPAIKSTQVMLVISGDAGEAAAAQTDPPSGHEISL